MTLLGVLKLFRALDRRHRLYLPSRQDHVPHDLLEVHLWRDSRIYRHCSPRGYRWSDQFFGEKEKELNEATGRVILSARIFINIMESSVHWAG